MTPSDITAYRIAHGLKQSELADQLGVRPLTVWRWESGKHLPSRYWRKRLEKLLEKSKG